MATTEYSNARENLREDKAGLFAFENNRLVRSDELIRNWPSVNDTIYKECHDFADQFVSAANTKAQRWVKDPMARKEVYPGTWRLVLNAYNPNRYGKTTGLVQILRKGFATTLEWDEAIMAKGDDLQESERYVHIAFPNCNPAAVASIIAELSTHTTTGFTLEGKERTGTWEWVHIRPDRLDDGSVTINVLAAQPQFTLTTYENYGSPDQRLVTYLNNVPKRLAQSVSDGWRTTGDSGTASYSTDQGVVDMVFRSNDAEALTILNVKTADGCQIEEYTSFYYNLTLAEARAFDIGSAPQGWFYSAPQIRYSGDGKYTAVIVKEHAIAVEKDAVTVADNPNDSETLKVYENQTNIPAVTSTQGILNGMQIQLNRFCLWAVRVVKKTSKPWTLTYTVMDQDGNNIVHTIKGNQTSVSIPSGTASTGVGSSSPERNQDGTYNYHYWVFPREITFAATTFYEGHYSHDWRRQWSYYPNKRYRDVLYRVWTTHTIKAQEYSTRKAAYEAAGSVTFAGGQKVLSLAPNRFIGFYMDGISTSKDLVETTDWVDVEEES
ncbi:MAG: hypothetical protein KJ626_03345 [Verrucomicrobia bacterium]|nr:hypothetical protein [Verrucomicrobiota bacterium]